MPSKVITVGEVMMRLSPPANARFVQSSSLNVLYAGSEANVSCALAFWGISSAHVTAFPDNDFGKAASMSLRQYGVNTDYIVFRDGRIGVYFIEGGASIRSPKIIYDRFDSAFAKLHPDDFDWNTILDGAEWFHWSGITPAISASAAEACLAALETAKRKGITISGDINYRRNLWQYGKTARDIMPALIQLSDVVIAGVTDFENCLGIHEPSWEETCGKVSQKYPAIRKVFMTERGTHDSSRQTLGGKMWRQEYTLTSSSYELSPIVDRVGAGDAFMAGIICGYLSGWDDQKTLDFATAACALKHTVEGDANTVSVAEVEAVVKGENVGKLLR